MDCLSNLDGTIVEGIKIAMASLRIANIKAGITNALRDHLVLKHNLSRSKVLGIEK